MATVLRPTPDAESDEKLELEEPTKQTQVDERSTDADSKKAPQRKWGSLNPLRLQKVPPIPEQRQVTGEYGAGLFSLVTFQWVYPLIKTGYLRELDIRDIWTVNPDRSVDKLSSKVEAAFRRRKERGCKRPLLRALHGVFKRELWISWVCQMTQMATSLLAPFVSRYLISYAMEAEDARQTGSHLPNVGRGMGYAVGITLLTVVSTVCSTHSFYWGGLAGGQMKAALMSLIFSKAMRLSGHAKMGAGNHPQQIDGKKPRPKKRFGSSTADDQQGWSNGRLLTIVGVDLERLERSCGTIHILWSVVTAVVVSFVVLMVTIGYSSLPSYGFLFAMVVASAHIIKIVLKYRRTMNKITDERITLTQEILQNVRFVKLFGWEGSFLQRFRQIRKREVKFLHKVVTTKHGAIVTTVSISSLAAMLSFITYAFTGHELTPDRIFAALGIFNALRGPFAILNMVISQATDAWAAIERIESLLLADEREDYIAWERDANYAIDIQHATFTWDFSATPESCGPDKQNNTTAAEANANSNDAPKQTAFRLEDIDLAVGNHELIAVIGAVGCGKSSLLSALASDMQLLSGSVRMGGTRAFCPQTAWIQNATVRDNILFGQDYDYDRYNEVLDACCLRPDLAILPDGDETEVGERGITLSGGQKQRINIARAAYSQCDVVLMDDPLSAVDAHVGSRIMDEVICGLLKDRCRVLATHQLHVLGRCDRIVVMDDGGVHAIGTFEDLMKTDEVFQGLMSRVSGSADDDSNDDSPTSEMQVEQPSDTEAKNEKPGGALMQQEERATGSTGLGIWKVYLQSSGSFLIPVVALALGLVTGVALVASGIWLSFWTSKRFPNMSVSAYAGIYAGISLAQVFILYLFALLVSIAGSISSRNMLQRAMHRVLRAPSSFFDTTPLGRITNRFSKDVDVLDEELPDHIRIFLFMGVNILGTAVLAIYFFHYFALVVVAVIILAVVITMYYRPGSRSVRRYEAVLRSAVVSRFTEAITGTSNIQAYKRETQFQQTFHLAIDSMNGARFITLADQRWSAFWVNTACCLLVLATGVLIASLKFGVSSSSSGLVLSYMLVMSSLLVLVLRQFSECQSGMTSVERLHHYGSSIEQEAPLHLNDVRPEWPETGRITFTDAQMRYREELPLVLQGLSMDIRGGERIGIVGRTGAGKSSIMATLFRLVELTSGSIKIDDVDITTVGLQDLRTRLAIIPQDPTLFKGTIRSNLDPFHQHTDLELWSALRKAHLIGEELPEETSSEDDDTSVPQGGGDVEKTTKPKRLHLDTPVEEDGSNFSLGQRQLMALARALVRDSRIIICDEATSSVDLETDAKVQETMARGFQGKTLLCIAHRLRTIIHYDRICVMDKGQIAEMDTPLALWERPGGIFRGMCEQSGITREDFYA